VCSAFILLVKPVVARISRSGKYLLAEKSGQLPNLGSRLLLARASNPTQQARVGDQTGGRVFLFLETDDFERDFAHYRSQGVEFVRGPSPQPYGTVAVFRDLYGNLWDLIGPPAAA
jgi:uncharacterized glyoxalase superfamily protein PhnB